MKQKTFSMRWKTESFDLEEILTKLEAQIGDIGVNLNEKPTEYVQLLLKKLLEYLESLKSESEKVKELETKVQNLLRVIRKEDLPSETTVPSTVVSEDAESGNSSEGTVSTRHLSLANDCSFRVDFPEEQKVLCMKDFKAKGKIYSLSPQVCQNCYDKHLVPIPEQKKREELDRIKRIYGKDSIPSGLDDRPDHDPFREPHNPPFKGE